MRIDVIDCYQAFLDLRPNWDAVYAADDDANWFLSWTFMSIWLAKTQAPETKHSEGWFILAVHGDDPAFRYVAFFPLRKRQRRTIKGADYIELAMGGRKYADYTGIICLPGYRDAAVEMFLGHIKSQEWMLWCLECLRLPDGEIDRWLMRFPPQEFEIRQLKTVNSGEETRQDICPFVTLPRDWPSYLDTRLSANTRQKLRRVLRQVEGSNCLRITHASGETIERDIKILLHLWRTKWRDAKGERLNSMLQLIGSMLMGAYRTGSLFLPILWHDRTPVGALGCFVDSEKGTMLFVIGARDETYDGPPPGHVLHAHSIRTAIGEGLRTYDFLRGNEPYKYSFGAAERRLANLVIMRRRARAIPL